MRRPLQSHVVLEQELQTLLKEDLDASVEDIVNSVGGSCDDESKNAIKKRVRVIKNRLAAKRSREQARTYVQHLESTLSALAAHNDFLARRLAAVEAENDSLKRGLPTQNSHESLDKGDQMVFRGEPAVLPLSSLQLDGIHLISFFMPLLHLILSQAGEWPVSVKAIAVGPPPPAVIPAQVAGSPRRTGCRRCKRLLRQAGLLTCPDHAGRFKAPLFVPMAAAA